MIDEKSLRSEEKAIFALRSLYRGYGYLPFKMSKFEEYDYYVKNKEFLVGDGVITFNDTNGRLLALKPDVTLSIIKNTKDEKGVKEKVCYSENVYRVSGRTHRYKEIMQTGLECIGDLDRYDVYEAVMLAAKSLATVEEDFMLDLSHMGILSALLDEASTDQEFRIAAIRMLGEKNTHELSAVCDAYGVSASAREKLLSLVSLYGTLSDALPRLLPLCESEKAREGYEFFAALSELLASSEYRDRIRIDFSVVNDMSYYNGVVMKGFLSGIAEGVLSGGEYGALLARMGRRSNGVGFALYLDLLEGLSTEKESYDVDVLVIYGEKTSPRDLSARIRALRSEGKRVTAQRAIPERLRYREILTLTGKES